MLSGNFSQGAWILSSARFSTEVIFHLCCKSPLAQLSACTGGNRKHFKDERHNKKTDNKESWNADIVKSLPHQGPATVAAIRSGFLAWCWAQDLEMSHVCLVFSHFNLCFPFSSSKIQQTENPMSSSCMCWGQRCSRLNRTLQIEFTLDETNRFARIYPPETGWPAPGNEPSHLQTVQCAQLINGILLEKCVKLWGEAMWSSRSQVQ